MRREMTKEFQMPPTPATEAECLDRMRVLLAAIKREATNRGQEDIADMAGRADELAEGLFRKKTS